MHALLGTCASVLLFLILQLHAGLCLDLLTSELDIPILGVCLGMQCMAQAAGGTVIRAPEPVHGRLSSITHRQHPLFDSIPSGAAPCASRACGATSDASKGDSCAQAVHSGSNQLWSVRTAGVGWSAVRYHSLVVEASTLPPALEAIAWASGPTSAVGASRQQAKVRPPGGMQQPRHVLHRNAAMWSSRRLVMRHDCKLQGTRT